MGPRRPNRADAAAAMWPAALAAAVLIAPAGGAPEAAERGQVCEVINAPSIRMFFEQWEKAVASGDAAAVAERYAPDAVLVPALSDARHVGRQAIEKHYREVLRAHPNGRVEGHLIRFGCGEALVAGVYAFGMDGPAPGARMPVRVRFTVSYQVRDGRWLIAHHHASRLPEDDSDVAPTSVAAVLPAREPPSDRCTLPQSDISD